MGGGTGEEQARSLNIREAGSAVGLLGLLDDPPESRAHIIVLRHGVMSQALQDPWVKLAILKNALAIPSLKRQREALPKYAPTILNTQYRRLHESVYRRLLATPVSRWRDILKASNISLEDDPVPEAVVSALDDRAVDMTELRGLLRGAPLNATANLSARARALRSSLLGMLRGMWGQVLQHADFTSPLLILDEAHHLKNGRTRLSSLFADEEAASEGRMLSGILAGRFERMLFLTATPFQLGHHELLDVLDRFKGVRWDGSRGAMTRAAYSAAHATLRTSLDTAYQRTTQFDRRWSSLKRELLVQEDGTELSPDAWWNKAFTTGTMASEEMEGVLSAYESARVAMKEAERSLRPWIVRHRRPATFEGGLTKRRDELDGDAITGITEAQTISHASCGLVVDGDALLPFLLAARAHVLAEDEARQNSASAASHTVQTFADGLASSYEAFLETRSGRAELDVDSSDEAAVSSTNDKRIKKYLQRIEGSLPSAEAFGAHPKVEPTVRRVLDLWDQGEKVLVFCHWKATGRALQKHISRELNNRLTKRAAEALDVSIEAVDAILERIGERFDEKGRLGAALREEVVRTLDAQHVDNPELRQSVIEIVRRYARTPSFIVRYLPLGEADDPVALATALGAQDTSGIPLRKKIQDFVRFIASRTDIERAEYLESLGKIQTGSRYAEAGSGGSSKGDALLANVRLVNGDMARDDRRKVLLAFNTPFFPEILIATSVMAEGVDLHLDCRHVIHHDLAWNPSTLEQRTGRVDRIASKAESTRNPIRVYHPFLGGCQDEKMYRVVMDRRRWFQVLMGQEYQLDSTTAEKLAERMPLPSQVAAELAFKLEVYENQTDSRSDFPLVLRDVVAAVMAVTDAPEATEAPQRTSDQFFQSGDDELAGLFSVEGALCPSCIHRYSDHPASCAAFPTGIPSKYLFADEEHLASDGNDSGLVYQPAEWVLPSS
jgi:ERCC4-related helicase